MRPVLAGMLLLAVPAQAQPAVLTFDDAMAAAMTHAPRLAAADAESDAASRRADAARAAGGVSATLSGTIGWGRLDPGGYFGLQARNVTPRAAQVVLEQPIYVGGRIAGGQAAARAGADAARAGLLAARAAVRADVAAAFGAVIAADSGVTAAQRLVEAVRTAAGQARLRFNAGEVPATDVSQADARLAEAEAMLAAATGAQAMARARLTRLTGQPVGALAALPGDPPLPGTLEDAAAEAMRNSPLLAQAQAGLAVARGKARMARAEGLPQVSAYAEGSTVRDQFFPGYRGDGASAGVRARWNFFSSGRTQAEAGAADADVRAAQARLDDARAAVTEMVVGAMADLAASRSAESATSRQQQAADAALASVRQEVRVGMKPGLALLDAARDAAQAATLAAQASARRAAAAWTLLAVVGRD